MYNPVETPYCHPLAELLQLSSPAYVPPEWPPPANTPARATSVAPRLSSEGGTAVPLSSRVLRPEVLDAWPAVRPLFENLSETSPNSVTTVLGRLSTEMATMGSWKPRMLHRKFVWPTSKRMHGTSAVTIVSWRQRFLSIPALRIPITMSIRHWPGGAAPFSFLVIVSW